MIAIINYGVGNLFSLKCSFRALGVEAEVTSDENVIKASDRIVLPGVGAFGDAADKLRASGLGKIVVNEAKSGKPLLGICLGMQLLFEGGYEYGVKRGLGLLKGNVRPISEIVPKGYKIPHMGWNALDFVGEKNELFKYIENGSSVYFVHSFSARGCDSVIATAEYGVDLCAAVASGNVYGCQFHPEKSGVTGMNILRAFCEVKGAK